MKILYLTFAFQHPSLRGPTRCYHFIKELSRRHEITLLSASRLPVPREALEEMAGYTEGMQIFGGNGETKSRFGKVLRRVPGIGARLEREWEYSRAVEELKKAFAKVVRGKSFDVLLHHGKDVFPVIEEFEDLPIVIDVCDATSMRILGQMAYARPVKRALLGLRYLRVKRLEKRVVRKSPHLAFISCRDREAVMGPGRAAEILPIGVDCEYWTRRAGNPQSNTIALVGVMNYAPNADAALYLIDEILPHIRKTIPDIRVLIVGRDPMPALLERAKRNPEVTVTGFVDDVRPYLERTAVAVAPLRYGAGIQNKVLEAMAMEVPVVTTRLAADGLRVEGEARLPLETADTAEEFAGQVVALLQNPARRAKLGGEGRQFVERNYVWLRSAETLEKICLRASAEAERVQARTPGRELEVAKASDREWGPGNLGLESQLRTMRRKP